MISTRNKDNCSSPSYSIIRRRPSVSPYVNLFLKKEVPNITKISITHFILYPNLPSDQTYAGHWLVHIFLISSWTTCTGRLHCAKNTFNELKLLEREPRYCKCDGKSHLQDFSWCWARWSLMMMEMHWKCIGKVTYGAHLQNLNGSPSKIKGS